MLRREKNQQSIEWRQCWRGWGVMRCEATRKIIKATFSSIKRQNGGFGSQSTRSHPQQPAAVWVRLSGAAVANYFYLSLTGPVPLRCFASLEPLLSPNSLMHACFTQNIKLVFWLGKYFPRCLCHTFWVRDTTIWLARLVKFHPRLKYYL